MRMPVSGLTHKDLGTCDSHFTAKKKNAEPTENQQLF